MRLARLRSALCLACIGVLAQACNWTTFASDALKAPVRSIKAPDGYTSDDFGVTLLPLSDGQGQAAAFVASSLVDPQLVVMKIDSGGGVSSATVAASSLASTGNSAIASLTEVPGGAPGAGAELLLGTPNLTDNTNAGQIYTLMLPDGVANVKLVPAVGSLGVGWRRGFATGHLTSDTATDFVVSSDRRVAVLVGATLDAAANAAISTIGGAAGCDVTFDWPGLDNRYRTRRPVLTARLWTDLAGGSVQQLVVGSTHSTAPGVVSFLSVDAAAGSLNCITTATKTTSHFGQALATGDFNGDGKPDLLVGAPSQHAFVYMGPFPAGGNLPTPIDINDSTGVDFGYAVAALNIDGQPGDEVLIGDPRATVGGVTDAGRVVAYKFDAGTMTPIMPFFSDHSPESGAGFGSSVNVLKFCTAASISPTVACPEATTARVLMVGAGNEVFVYYQVGDNIPLRTRDGLMVHDVRGP